MDGHGDVTRIIHLLTLLAVIAVPAVGWFAEEWSGGTTLAVYWFETAAMCLSITARIFLHQRWNPRHGHFRYNAPKPERRSAPASFVKGFVVTSFAFCAAHGVFLTVILVGLSHNGAGELADVDWRSVGRGCLSVLVFLAIDFVVDLPSLRQRSFLELEQTAARGMSRVVVVHLTLVIGFLGIAVTGAPTAIFGVFVVLKTLHALSTALPQWEPITAPSWLSRVMNRLPTAQPGRSFEDQWDSDRADESQRRNRNEQPWVGARR